jgi:hypothetical protein
MGAAPELFSLLAIAVVVMTWQWLRGAHEHALVAARAACQKAGVQWLDQSVALSRVRLAAENGQWGWSLDYRFDLSRDGHERGHGRIRLHRGAVLWIEMPGRDGPELWLS